MKTISRNELIGLLKQAFEGIGFSPGDYENTAEMVTYAQMYGLEGLSQLALALPLLLDQKQSIMKLVAEDAHSATMDALGCSSVLCGSTALDFAYVKALEQPLATVTVLNCHHRGLIFKKLLDYGLRGVACTAYWRDCHDNYKEHLLRVTPSGERGALPEYRYQRLEEPGDFPENQEQSLLLRCSSSTQTLADHESLNPWILNPTEYRLDSNFMLNAFEQFLKSGIPIDEDLWLQLTALATRVLVESSEQSRLGAGA